MTSDTEITARLQYNDQSLTLYLLGRDGNPLPGAAPLLQGTFALECTDPRCVSGTQPFKVGMPPLDVEEPIQITQGPDDLQPRLLAGANGTSRSLSVLDRSFGTPCSDNCGKRDGKGNKITCGGLCGALAQRRRDDSRISRFLVYQVTSASGQLSQLQDTLIAIPIVEGLAVKLAAAS